MYECTIATLARDRGESIDAQNSLGIYGSEF